MKRIKNKRFWFLSAAASGAMLNPLNSSMISLALHRIQKDFHLSFSTVSWLISSFYLASVIAQPVMGKIGDQLGKKKIFLAGLLLVAVSALGAPWAPTFFILLLMRLFQSIGSSSIYPAAISLVRDHIREKQASALAVISTSTSATAALGPTVGGLLIAWGDWPAIFTINFPILLVSFILGWLFFPRDTKKMDQSFAEMMRKFDIPGILLFALGMTCLLWFLLSLSTKVHPLSGVAGVVFLAAFIWRELRTEEAFIDIRMFKTNGALAFVLIQFILLNIYNYSLFFGLPSYLQDTLHFDVRMSGLLMLFLSGFSMLISPVAGKWIDRSGFKKPLIAGTTLMLVGAFLLAAIFASASVPIMACILIIVGISYGLNNVSLQAAMLEATPPGMIGTTSGLFQASRYMGSILSSVALGLVFGKEITAVHFQILIFILIVVSAASCFLNVKLRNKEWGH